MAGCTLIFCNEHLIGPVSERLPSLTFQSPLIHIAGAGVELDPFPSIKAWIERCESRPATKQGLSVPKYTDPAKILENADQRAKEARMFPFPSSLTSQG